jgi:hypothetical protein
MEPDPLFAPLGTAIERNRPRPSRHDDAAQPPDDPATGTAHDEAPSAETDGAWIGAGFLVLLWAWYRLRH